MRKTFLIFAFSLLIFTLNSCSENDESITRISAFKNLYVDKIGKDSDIGQKVKSDLEQFEEKIISFNFNNIQRTPCCRANPFVWLNLQLYSILFDKTFNNLTPE